MHTTTYALFCAGMILLTSCTQPKNKADQSSQNADEPTAKAQSRPTQKEGFLMPEGMKEPVTLNLFETPETFPLSFSTYIPDDMQAETIGSGKQMTIRFVSAFGGKKNPEARMQTGALSPGMKLQEARGYAQKMIQSIQGTSAADDPSRYPWAEMTYALRGSRAGFLSLAKHEDRWFYILLQYPPEYGDGMAPRSALILNQWRWRDTGAWLK